jgi:hypothetical protein
MKRNAEIGLFTKPSKFIKDIRGCVKGKLSRWNRRHQRAVRQSGRLQNCNFCRHSHLLDRFSVDSAIFLIHIELTHPAVPRFTRRLVPVRAQRNNSPSVHSKH